MHHSISKWALIALLLLCGVLFGWALGAMYYINPDEARYTDIAREMWASGSWVTPKLDGTAFLDKPILFYWVEIALMKTFGLHEWSVRLLPAGFASLACIMNYIAGVKLYDRKTGILAALVLLTSTLFFIVGHYTNMDLMVASLISCSLWLFLIAVASKVPGYLYGAYVFAGLAFLTKGMIAIVLPGLIIGVWILCYRKWSLLKTMRIPSGILIILLINLPWFLAVEHQNPEFYYYFFYVQQFVRFASKTSFNMQNPWYYYLVIIAAGLIPWLLFLFQALIKSQRTEKEVFILLWVVLITVFFSIPTSKTPGYILPVFPPLAFLIGRYLASNTLKLRAVSFIYGLLFLSLLGFVCLSPFAAQVPIRAVLPSLVITGLGTLVLIWVAFRAAQAFVPVFIIIQCLFLASLIQPVALYFNSQSIYPLASLINQSIQPQDVIVEYEQYNYDLPLYVQRDIKVVSDWNQRAALMEDDSWRRELAEDILYKQGLRQPNLVLPSELPALWGVPGRRIFLLARPSVEPSLKPLYVLGQDHGMILLSNEAGS